MRIRPVVPCSFLSQPAPASDRGWPANSRIRLRVLSGGVRLLVVLLVLLAYLLA
ncbi:MAG: hypothetical protein JWN47_3433 [Frankiales bacterium]|nr:hypothetical protein [Frankiales bacterium]